MDKEKNEPKPQQPADTTPKIGGGSAADNIHDEFYTTGRIGRRNAMPDILGKSQPILID